MVLFIKTFATKLFLVHYIFIITTKIYFCCCCSVCASFVFSLLNLDFGDV